MEEAQKSLREMYIEKIKQRIFAVKREMLILKQKQQNNDPTFMGILEYDNEDEHNITPEDQNKIWYKVKKGIESGKSNNTLYVTSFAKDMYDISGKTLIETFTQNNPDKFMLVCYENMDFQCDSDNILKFDLKDSAYLCQWIIRYADDIPIEFGGLATEHNNPRLFRNYFNKSASRWFRKIVSLEYAIKTLGKYFEHVVWIDADCYAIRSIPDIIVNRIFNNYDVIYHLGKKRIVNDLGVESGIIGFKRGAGYDFLLDVSNKFRYGSFMTYARWDDGYIFRESIFECNKKNLTIKNKTNCLDLVNHVRDSERNEVIPYGPFRYFFVHDKGKHNILRGEKVKNIVI
jgi:hypothetical protein